MIWFAALGKFLGKIPWQIYAAAALIALFFSYGRYEHHKGAAEVRSEWDKSIAKGKVLVADLQKKRVVTNTVVRTEFLDRVRVVKEKGDVIVKQVPIYIPVGTPDLPGGFRLLHDAAVTGTPIPATEGANAASVPVTEAASTIAENYKRCRENITQLESLQDWIRRQQTDQEQVQREQGRSHSTDNEEQNRSH